MNLIDLFVQETLSGKFKWPECCYALVQGSGGAVYLAGGGMPLQKFELAEDWELAEVTREQYEAALAAAQPQWDGEGLPPVGAVCKVQYWNDGLCEKVKIIAYHNGEAWVEFVECNGKTALIGNPEFCPIRSEADRKREKFIQAVIDFDKRIFGSTTTRFGALYDAIAAGKIPGIRIE